MDAGVDFLQFSFHAAFHKHFRHFNGNGREGNVDDDRSSDPHENTLNFLLIADRTYRKIVFARKDIGNEVESVEVAGGALVGTYEDYVGERKFFLSGRVGNNAANINALRDTTTQEKLPFANIVL